MKQIRFYNSLSRSIEVFTPLGDEVRLYSCGPTVYDQAHIGNLSSFIFNDTLRRVLEINELKVRHVMNLTDVDDKTIKKSQLENPNDNPMEALKKTTSTYRKIFFDDMARVGNDLEKITFSEATSPETMKNIQLLTTELVDRNIAYISDDGIYFDILAYKKTDKKYGQLVAIPDSEHSQSRINSDEYDKNSPHDFALWKKAKDGEPTWDFEIAGQNMRGRPGWHIECSAMSRASFGQPFDIHTGGIDLKFPHHENEIAQSTACENSPIYANFFMHNEHTLVDGKKMSKSLGNFYTLSDLEERGIDPLAFRMLTLQSHYRKSGNFTFENLIASKNRLENWRKIACLRHQNHKALTQNSKNNLSGTLLSTPHALLEVLNEDLNTPQALAVAENAFDAVSSADIESLNGHIFIQLIDWLDEVFGLKLAEKTPDINDSQKQLILERERAREKKNWQRSDEIRDILNEQGIELNDRPTGAIWNYKPKS